MFEIIKGTSINFSGMRKYAYILSGILVLIGIFAFVQVLLGRANLGIEFTGGTMVQASYERHLSPEDIGKIRSAISQVGFGTSEIQQVSGGGRYMLLIRLKRIEATGGTISDRILETLGKTFPEIPFRKEATQDVGPTVGADLQHKAVWAIFWALIAIAMYIWIRFRTLDFGIAALVATMHDVFVLLGIVFLLRLEITLLIVTALLTIAGYSLTDTVVVFDRIRENLRTKRREGLFKVINLSVNEILSRTILTGGTTLVAVASLLLLGGDVTRNFALTLFIGLFLGTYSSWFVASPILLEWEKVTSTRERKGR
jgi:preprotein translocase SecF subunit